MPIGARGPQAEISLKRTARFAREQGIRLQGIDARMKIMSCVA
ncbi:hypothetical protein HMPREF0762_01767 [Slackia exigua ATCC 700122]|uniref:Uncharacterized protein n=1 Tax=Slackia exigua (strain ATCC 700122 / DSM 15923 / CIP 105133 / JCM 11022 / KCTC 5966 / S-7) TaxID=649764 RepID=D0WIU2_SLAES|nr:hypothetical protein HMPREF0762_01767 [Slackia exigua ATCC 700122]